LFLFIFQNSLYIKCIGFFSALLLNIHSVSSKYFKYLFRISFINLFTWSLSLSSFSFYWTWEFWNSTKFKIFIFFNYKKKIFLIKRFTWIRTVTNILLRQINIIFLITVWLSIIKKILTSLLIIWRRGFHFQFKFLEYKKKNIFLLLLLNY